MADTRIYARQATAVLREDHRKVKELFEDYEASGERSDEEKFRLFSRIHWELSLHATLEEEIFYPAVEGVQKGGRNGADIVAKAREEHRGVKTLLEELAGLDPAFEAFDAKMNVLREAVERHADEEESEIFPLFDDLEKEDQEIVSEHLDARKTELCRETPETPDE